MYGSWDMVCDKCNCYFSFCATFCPFTPLTAQKLNILKKWKKHLEIYQFTYVHKIMMRWCTVPEIWCMKDLFFTLGHFCPFTLPPTTTAQKIKILKKVTKCLKISSFYVCVPRTMIRWHIVPEIWCVTDVIVISHFELFFNLLPH